MHLLVLFSQSVNLFQEPDSLNDKDMYEHKLRDHGFAVYSLVICLLFIIER
jgi:hypothetical protein